ncbi:MAG: 3-hydroxy-9,10-secoandrosta,3,5(10)-triene-9,17-dione monooxygenase [Actinomycetota bacterium]|nr:3-hydroxy-9,10-secoandrosta,3,5(10)-triene-9,17-dione monooxygenase [Actinomycetota bacterium]
MSTATGRDAPLTATDLSERARQLFPVFRKLARQADEGRHLPVEMVEAYAEAGFVRTLVPTRWGGLGLGFTEALDVIAEIAKASGSMGWVGSFWIDHPHWVALYPEDALRDVWSAGPDVRIATSFVPVGRVTAVEGGWLLSGEWAWASGVGHSDWVMLGGLIMSGDGPPTNALFLVPTSEITVVDTWYSAGLRGSGSDNVVADQVFVPHHRILPMEAVREGRAPGALAYPSPVLTAPLMTHAGYAMVAPAIGIARGVIEEWESSARSKVHSYTKEQVAAALPMQLQISESTALVDAAEMLVRACLARVESGEPLGLEQRVRNRRDISFAARLITRAVDDLMQMAGASALRDESPIQRGWRDVRAISSHVMLNVNAAGENFGRMRLGLPLNPRDPFF